jgi:DNA-binding NarL/FixJ family response regulator
MQNQVTNGQRSTSSRGVATGNGNPSDYPEPAEKSVGSEGTSPTKTPIKPPIEPPIKTKVLIAHCAPLVRFGLAGLVDLHEAFAVCAQTDAAPIARAMFVEHQPQLVILGLTLHGGDGIELIRDFRRLKSAAGILVLADRDDALSIQRAFRAGARGYSTIADDPAEVLRALEQIAAGRLYASSSVLPRLLDNLAKGETEPANPELNALSDRELQVFSLIGRGFGASRLANELHLSIKTIETYQMHLKEKLGLRSAAELSERAAHWILGSMRRNLRMKKQLIFGNGHTSTQPGVSS